MHIKDKPVALTVERKGATDTLHANVNADGKLGFAYWVDSNSKSWTAWD